MLKLSGLRLIIIGQPEMGIILLTGTRRVQLGEDRLWGSECVDEAACVWYGETVSEETYREERCLTAVVLFYRNIKTRKIVFFKT